MALRPEITNSSRRKLGLLAAVALGLLLVWLVLDGLGMPTTLSSQALADWLASQGARGPLLLMLLMILAVVVGPIPTLPISATAGLVYGVVNGTAIAALGALMGAMLAFSLARFLGRDSLQHCFPGNPLLAPDSSQRYLTLTILLTRLVPVFSFALISYAAGVTAIQAWRFALATLVGMLPMTVVYAGLGHHFAINPLLTVVAAMLILVLMATLPFWLARQPHSRVAIWLGWHQRR